MMMAKLFNLKFAVIALALALASLSGVVVAEDEGCVTCHAGPMGLNELLPAKNANHPDISGMVNTVPTDCAMCHAAGTDMALMNLVHPRHEGVDCVNCHAVDEAGAPTAIKSGAKNW